MRSAPIFSVFLLMAGALAHAEPPPEASRAILVLDASGSMWGQIQGQAKIAIARDAVGSMLDGWPGGELGLMAYGHRRKGDCEDIELLIAPDGFDAAAIRQQASTLTPMGMTPIAAAVRQAADALRYTEQKATVVLISDGEETCSADPCALGEELERMGIDFTAHVVGFDIQAGSTADKQLRCLAEHTGGRYVQARDAGALNHALGEIAGHSSATVSAREGEDWMEGYGLEAEVGIYMDPDGTESLGNHDFTVEQTAADCQAMCMAEEGCAGWHYEPTGSYFVSYPRCHLKGSRFAVRLSQQGEGWVAGIKPGVKLILDEQPVE